MINQNPNLPIANLAVGTIVEVDGSHIVAEVDPGVSDLTRTFAGETYAIGQFGSIVRVHYGRRNLYALVGRLRMKADFEAERGLPPTAAPDERILEADLFGEGDWTQVDGEWSLTFERGVSAYPLPRQTVYLTPRTELKAIFRQGVEKPVIKIGEHVGGDAPCFADLNELLGKHTAVLGSTGAGKSAAVAALIRAILDRKNQGNYSTWQPQIVVLDPHNEYASAFPEASLMSPTHGTLRLPYWLLSFQETIDLLIGKTEFVATSQANIVKSALLTAREEGADAIGIDKSRITVDSPVPYSLDRFKTLVDASRTGTRSTQSAWDSILAKLEVLQSDARMSFLTEEWSPSSNDPFPEILGALIGETHSVRIIDLSGMPNEVAGICSAVIARSLFNLKVWQSDADREASPVLLVCEEAHRYVPNRGEAQYEAAKDAIRRVAKEGRKYGVALMIVSQRPSEVEDTVLSQCSSWLILRITNDADRSHVRSMLPDSVAGLVKTLSSLRRREAIFLGQAAAMPSRILIENLAPDQLPRSRDIDFDKGWQCAPLSIAQLSEAAEHWRYQSTS